MKHYIVIETPPPPIGATHYNPRLSLAFEKHVDGQIYVWTGSDWNRLNKPEMGRGGSYPIVRDYY